MVVASPASATTIVLDATNGYLYQIEPGAFIEQPAFEATFNYITGTNVQFALGTSDTAVFPGVSQIGSGVQLGGNKPRQLVLGAIPFTILVTSSGQKYDALLTYFDSFGEGPVGVPPVPNNIAGAVFEVTAASPVPEPATLLLLGSGLAAAGARRRLRRRA